MKQDRTHYSLRMNPANADALDDATKTFGDSANSTLNAALALGFACLLKPWAAVHLKHAVTAERSRLRHNGNANHFRAPLTPR